MNSDIGVKRGIKRITWPPLAEHLRRGSKPRDQATAQVRLRRAAELVELVWPDGHTAAQLACVAAKAVLVRPCARARADRASLTLLDADVGASSG